MADGTGISWTDATWSPLLGCTPASAACANCYARRDVWRMAHNPNPKIAAPRQGLVEKAAAGELRWTGKVALLPEQLQVPLAWRKPRRVFVANQADLFHPDVPEDFILSVFSVMAQAGQHTFQVLTKRPARMRDFLQRQIGTGPALRNVWLGTTVEDQRTADERIPELLATPARVRFLSCEPLLGPVNLEPMIDAWAGEVARRVVQGRPVHPLPPRIGWVIVGGESGPGARPMHPAWARALRDQCAEAGVPFHFKQWGEWAPLCDYYERDDSIREPALDERGVEIIADDGGTWDIDVDYQPAPGCWLMAPRGKKRAGRELDGRTHDAFPEVTRA